jgi:hypothetical protein
MLKTIDPMLNADVLYALRAMGVCTENLNPNVVVMKSAQAGVRTYDAESLNRTRDRRILVQ